MSAPTECRSREEWERLLSRPLPPTEADPLAEHLEHCNSCATTVESVLGKHTIVEALRERPGVETPKDEVQRIIARFRDASEQVTDSFAPGEAEATQAADNSSPGARLAPFLSPPRGPDEIGRLGNYRVVKQLGCGGKIHSKIDAHDFAAFCGKNRLQAHVALREGPLHANFMVACQCLLCPLKADIPRHKGNVRFGSEAGKMPSRGDAHFTSES